jgi:hypothetical protein
VNVYFIPGLGVDNRVFQKIKLPPGFKAYYFKWISPASIKEPIEEYAKRLAQSVDVRTPYIIIGLSFGGIIAKELQVFLSPEKTIIISSVSSPRQLPWYLKMDKYLSMHRLLPAPFMKSPNPLLQWIFGIKTREEKALFNSILHDTDDKVLKWSIRAIVHWNNYKVAGNIIHIHGTKDKLLPIQFINADYKIEGGEHFMVYSKATEVSAVLSKLLS